jgi:transposase
MRQNYRRPPPLAGTTAVRKSLRDGLDQWSGRRESNPHGQLGRHAKHTLGLLLTVTVCAASVQDRDGAKTALLGAYLTAPACRFVFADAGFAGRLVDWAHDVLATTISIVRKPPDQKGFAVLPRRWAVERTLAWLTAHRRLARDYERHPATSEAMIRWAASGLMTRRLARGGRPTVRQHRRHLEYT